MTANGMIQVGIPYPENDDSSLITEIPEDIMKVGLKFDSLETLECAVNEWCEKNSVSFDKG